MINILKTSIFSLTVLIFFSCAGVEEPLLPPEVPGSEIRITDISFSDISIEQNILIANPNNRELEIAGCDSSLFLSDTALAKEIREKSFILGPYERFVLTVPFHIGYKELYRTGAYSEEQRRADCRIETVLRFIHPKTGIQSLEVKSESVLPLIREPLYDFDSLYVNSLGMMGADIIVRMAVINPNDFDILLENFQGDLKVNKQNWSALKIADPLPLAAGEISETIFRFRLEFLSMGKTVRDLLSGESELLYDFTGESALTTEREFLEEEELPLALDGQIGLYKPEDTHNNPHSSLKIEQSIEDTLLHIFGPYTR